MAAVYKARHLTLDSEHAIKVLFITAPQVRARLLREGRVQANLRNPNIVSVTDVLEVQGAPALVMEYVDGPALDEWLLANKPTLDQALWLFRGILRGIHAAHERGVVHRDLKPANVLLSPRPEGFVPKVTDFGLVKSVAEEQREGQTQTGMALGTPEYMSPEQIRDASEVDQRADMWALGCILYELVCHRRAFQGPDKMSTFNAIVAGTYVPPARSDVELPEMVTDAIRALLVVDRDDRLASTAALASVLYEESESRPGRLAPPPRPVRPLLVSAPAPLVAVMPASLDRTPLAGTVGVGPTGKPAAARSIAPAPRFDESPISTRDTMELKRLVPGRRMGLPIAAGAAALLAAGIAGWVTTRPRPLPEPQVESARTAPGTEVAPVAAVATEAAPEVAPSEPAPSPRPALRRPAPPNATAAAPVPVPLPMPVSEMTRAPAAGPAGTATITFDGDARSIWLESSGRRVEPGAVPPGTYAILADFGDPEPARAGTVTLAEGDQRVLVCSSFFSQCK